MERNKTSSSKQNVVVAVDPGNIVSGVVVLCDGNILHAENAPNAKIVDFIKSWKKPGVKLRVVIEDMMPYLTKSSPQFIETCKYMGEMRYRLKSSRIAFKFISRSTVKTWVFKTYPEVCIPDVDKKIQKKGYMTKDGHQRKASHVYVDDNIVVKAMRREWNVEGIAFQKNRYGLSEHSWQALALGTMYIKS